MYQARVLLAALLLTPVAARGDVPKMPSVSDGSTALWTAPETTSEARFSRTLLEDWLCSPEPPGSPPPEPPPPDEDPDGIQGDDIDVTCDLLDSYVPQGQQEPLDKWRSPIVLETAATADSLQTRLRRLCLTCKREIELACGSFVVDMRLDPLVEQPWSHLTLFPLRGAGAYQGDLTVALEMLFTHVENGWTARLPRWRTYSGFGRWADTLEGNPVDWPELIDADCDAVPETLLPPSPASFRPAAGRSGGKDVECLFDVLGSGRLCWTSVPGLP